MKSIPEILKIPELTLEEYKIIKQKIEKNEEIKIFNHDSAEFVRTRQDEIDPTNWKEIEYIALYPKISTMSPDRLDYLLMSILPLELIDAWNFSKTKTNSNGYYHFPGTTFIYDSNLKVTETINSFQNLIKQEHKIDLKIPETVTKNLVHISIYPSKEIAYAAYNHSFPELDEKEMQKVNLPKISKHGAKTQDLAEHIISFFEDE